MPEGINKTFAKSAHNLWVRFRNYDKHFPFALEEDGDIKCIIMITELVREPYANLYEIVTKQGEEGKGYARRLYWDVMSYMYGNGVERLKMSCTPSSMDWHNGNGIVGWGVDSTGSIRVDIPIERDREHQLQLREDWSERIGKILPPKRARKAITKENHTFGAKKTEQVNKAKFILGNYYLRDLLASEDWCAMKKGE
jgi:hypothetical protein